MKKQAFLINGEWIEARDTLPVVNPATEQTISHCAVATTDDAHTAVTSAAAAFPAWRDTDIEQRSVALMRFADLLEQHFDELCDLLTLEQGKPKEGFANLGAGFEVGGAIAWTRATASLRLPVEVVQDDDTARIELHRKPLGVVVSITPWNYPLLIAIWHIIPALLAGNTVVMKPSEYTPLTVARAVELLQPLLPKGVINMVVGKGDVGASLTAHPSVAKVVFTGSTQTGRRIMQSASATVKRLTLELGGNDAAIVLPDVDVNAVAPKIFATAMINNGQTCAALKRLFVHEDVHDSLCEALAGIARSVTTGDGASGADFGPIQNKAQYEKVVEIARDAQRSGGKFLAGGLPPEGQAGYFFPVSIVSGLDTSSRLVAEEPFGPILPVIKYSNLDDAVAMANASDNGLGGSVWSNDVSAATEIAKRLECGTAWVNNHAMIQPNVPFGGVKQSGVGVEFGQAGLEEFTSTQALQVWKV